MLWGTFDWQHGANHPYDGPSTLSGGADAALGVGARRVTLVIDRTGAVAGADPAVMHFDMLNITAGNPDDTWTSGDYTTLEGYIDTLWTGLKPYVAAQYKLAELRWYRVGPGVVPPNPAERVSTRSVVGTSGGIDIPPQVSCSLTFRTAVRHSWGRTYLPLGSLAGGIMGTNKQLGTAAVDTIAGALNTFATSCASSDFVPVVYSATKQALLAWEKVEVDSNLDVVRRRRWKQSAYKKILP